MIHILDMSADRWRALCGTDTPFRVSPGLHQSSRSGVDCVVCLDLDDHARQAAAAAHTDPAQVAAIKRPSVSADTDATRMARSASPRQEIG